MNIKLISFLTLVCVAYGQEVPSNQLTEEQPAVQQFVPSNEDQNVRSNDQQKPQFIVIEKVPEHHNPHEEQIQAFVIQQNQQQHHKHDHHKQQEPQKIVVQLGEHKPQHEKIIIAQPIHSQQHHKHQQEIFVKPEEVIKIPVHEPQHPMPQKPLPPLVSHNRLCVVLGRKGECLSIPNFFSCMRDLGVLTPAIGECSFTQACCVRNWFGQ